MTHRIFIAALSALALQATYGEPITSVHDISGSVVIVGNHNYIVQQRESTKPTPEQIDFSASLIFEGGIGVSDPLEQEINGLKWLFPEEFLVGANTGQIIQGLLEPSAGGGISNPLFPEAQAVLDLRLLNNSERQISLRQVILDVKESKPDLTPYIVPVTNDDPGVLYLRKEGWSKISGCWLRFRCCTSFSEAQKAATEKSFPYNLEIGPIERLVAIDLAHILVREGIDIPYFRKLSLQDSRPSTKDAQRALGRFRKVAESGDDDDGDKNRGCHLYIAGIIEISQSGDNPSPRKSYSTIVGMRFVPDGRGDGMDESIAVTGELKTNAKNYALRYPVAILTKPGHADRLTVKLTARRSSWHTLTPRVVLTDGTTFAAPALSFYYFAPLEYYDGKGRRKQILPTDPLQKAERRIVPP